MSEFYVGYLPKAPQRLGRMLFRVVAGLNGMAAALALLLVLSQAPFARSVFEFLQYREYRGFLVSSPYPALVTPQARYLLVAPGKHGAGDWGSGNVQLTGSLIRRGDDRMLEVVPGSLRAVAGAPHAESPRDLGAVTLTGEIVDSKCYFGVMNPGSGKVHRACAVRCISGGIPPALAVKDASGVVRPVILSGVHPREVLDMIAEPVTIHGRLQRLGDKLLLAVERRGNKPAIERH